MFHSIVLLGSIDNHNVDIPNLESVDLPDSFGYYFYLTVNSMCKTIFV